MLCMIHFEKLQIYPMSFEHLLLLLMFMANSILITFPQVFFFYFQLAFEYFYLVLVGNHFRLKGFYLFGDFIFLKLFFFHLLFRFLFK